MSFNYKFKNFVAADSNPATGLYHFVATFSDQTQVRLMFTNTPEWKLIGTNRLLTVPCPVCRRDYYCNCMSKYAAQFEEQVIEGELYNTVD
jgi:hypothetical protein